MKYLNTKILNYAVPHNYIKLQTYYRHTTDNNTTDISTTDDYRRSTDIFTPQRVDRDFTYM